MDCALQGKGCTSRKVLFAEAWGMERRHWKHAAVIAVVVAVVVGAEKVECIVS